MFNLKRFFTPPSDLVTSKLFNEKTFYKTFLQDLEEAKEEVIIESPYITSLRMTSFYSIFQKLLNQKIKIHIITRDPIEHDENMRYQATNEILSCDKLCINIILLRGYHHRKLAIVDKKILWEGSLNILSQCNSKEIMRRIEGQKAAKDMFHFLNFAKII